MVYSSPPSPWRCRHERHNWMSFRHAGGTSAPRCRRLSLSPEMLDETPDYVEKRRALIDKVTRRIRSPPYGTHR